MGRPGKIAQLERIEPRSGQRDRVIRMTGQVVLVFLSRLVVAVDLAQRLRQAVPGRVEVGIAFQGFAVVPLPGTGIVDLGAAIDLREPEEGAAVGRRVVDPAIDHGLGAAEPIGLEVDSCQGLIDAGVGLRRDAPETGQDRLRLGELAQLGQPDRANAGRASPPDSPAQRASLNSRLTSGKSPSASATSAFRAWASAEAGRALQPAAERIDGPGRPTSGQGVANGLGVVLDRQVLSNQEACRAR